jgi:hypothetical protein
MPCSFEAAPAVMLADATIAIAQVRSTGIQNV